MYLSWFSSETEPIGDTWFIIRNWLTWLSRLRSPKICSWQVRDPGELMVLFQLESRGLGTIRTNGLSSSENQQAWDSRRTYVSVWVQRQEKGWSQLNAVRRVFFLIVEGSAFWFYSGPQLTGWSPPTLGRSLLIQTLILETPSRHTQKNGWPNVWTLHGPVKLTY